MGSSYLYPSFFPLSRPTMTAKTLSRIAVKSCTSNMPTRGKWRNLKVNMGMELVPIYGNFMGNLRKYHGNMDGNWRIWKWMMKQWIFGVNPLQTPIFFPNLPTDLLRVPIKMGRDATLYHVYSFFGGTKTSRCLRFFLWLSEGSGCNDWRVPYSNLAIRVASLFQIMQPLLKKWLSCLSAALLYPVYNHDKQWKS